VTELGFNTCQKIKPGKRVVNVNLKPEVELPELVAWISSITCKSFILPGHLSGAGKKVTFVAHGAMTREEAFAAFLSAIDTLGLTIERGPGYLKIIETSKAKMSSSPSTDSTVARRGRRNDVATTRRPRVAGGRMRHASGDRLIRCTRSWATAREPTRSRDPLRPDPDRRRPGCIEQGPHVRVAARLSRRDAATDIGEGSATGAWRANFPRLTVAFEMKPAHRYSITTDAKDTSAPVGRVTIFAREKAPDGSTVRVPFAGGDGDIVACRRWAESQGY
jgi:hypothetical protein